MSSKKRALPLECPYCHGPYMGLTGVNQHIRRTHRANIPTDFQCERCGEYLNTRVGLMRHINAAHSGEIGSKRRKVSEVHAKAEYRHPTPNSVKVERAGNGGMALGVATRDRPPERLALHHGGKREETAATQISAIGSPQATAQCHAARDTKTCKSEGEHFEQCVCCELMVPAEALLKHTLQHTAELMSAMGSWSQKA